MSDTTRSRSSSHQWRRAVALVVVGIVACAPGPTPFGPEAPRLTDSASSSLGSPSPSTNPDFPFRRILCFGDSLTLGVTSRIPGAGQSLLVSVEGYVPKLARLLAREFGGDISLMNSGVGGEGVEPGSERFSAETRVHEPDLVLLLEGVVNVNNPTPRFEAVRKSLRKMIRTANDRRIPLIIGTVPPLNREGFRTRGAENVPVLNEIIRELAAQEGVPVADHEEAFGGDLSLQGPDGLHPNNRGYGVMAETWFQAILALMT